MLASRGDWGDSITTPQPILAATSTETAVGHQSLQLDPKRFFIEKQDACGEAVTGVEAPSDVNGWLPPAMWKLDEPIRILRSSASV